jgi:hypothetical protein
MKYNRKYGSVKEFIVVLNRDKAVLQFFRLGDQLLEI